MASAAEAPSEDGSTPRSEGQPGLQTVQAELLVLADDPDVHPSLAACFAANSLVWDGRLVVDAQLRTNDDHIYAAGTLAKFSRRWAEAPPTLTAACCVARPIQAPCVVCHLTSAGHAGSPGRWGTCCIPEPHWLVAVERY